MNRQDIKETIFAVKDTVGQAEGVASNVKFFTVGLVLTIGSIGLLLGGVTTGLAVLLMYMGMTLLPAIVIAFVVVGLVGFWTGLWIARKAYLFLKERGQRIMRR